MGKKSEIIRGAISAFCEAILAGYAGNGMSVRKIRLANGEKTNIWQSRNGDWVVVDRWTTTTLSNWSAGTTTVLYKNQAVWWMSYGGWYDKSVIPFLKEALKNAYKRGAFIGGRGREHFSDPEFPGLAYTNKVSPVRKDPTMFDGEEQIIGAGGELMGFHRYHGMSLLG